MTGKVIPRPALAAGVLVSLPFPILLVLIWLPHFSGMRETLVLALQSYAALTLVLMGGSHWSLMAGPYGKVRIASEGLIGLAALAAAAIALMLDPVLAFPLLIAAFLLIVLRDAMKAEATGFEPWLVRGRGFLSAIVVVSLVLALIRAIS